MKFRIFWIDDAQSWVASIYEDVKDAFSSVGFNPEINTYTDTEQATDPILSGYADLIIVDCNLPKGTRGDQFIRNLRHKRCFAHVLFYSQNTTNLGIFDSDKQFIHVTHRDGVTDILEEIADQAFRKYRHPAFMRGLLLSEFIDLENLMEDLIVQSFKHDGEYFRKNVLYKGGESYSLVTKQKFISRMIKEVHLIDTSMKEKAIFSTSQFEANIVKRRNVLAHAHPEYNENTGSIILKSAIEDVNFDSNWFHETREHIHQFKKKIRDLMNLNLQSIVNP